MTSMPPDLASFLDDMWGEARLLAYTDNAGLETWTALHRDGSATLIQWHPDDPHWDCLVLEPETIRFLTTAIDHKQWEAA